MGILRTQSHQLPYPDGAENVDVVTDLGELAKAVDTALGGVESSATSPVSLDDLTDVSMAGAAAVDGQGLLYEAATGLWKPGDYPAGSTGATTLDGLTDVDTTTTAPVAGQALVFDGAVWSPAAVAGGDGTGATTLDGLTDVDTTTVAPADGEVLTFDSATGLWHPAVAPAAEPASIDTHTDVDTTTTVPATGQALVWNGSQWVPGTVSGDGGGTGGATTLDELTDVDTTTVTPVEGYTLFYRANTGQWLPGVPASPGATNLDGLTDVDTTTTAPTSGQLLGWNGSRWVPVAAPTGGGGSLQDTGWRIVPLRGGWTGTAYLRRVGNTVRLHLHNANYSSLAGNLNMYDVVAGFRFYSGLQFSANIRVGIVMDDAATGGPRVVQLQSNVLKLMANVTTVSYGGQLAWTTDDAWPTTLPGTAA